jgi:DNA topoisomerase-3
METAGKALDDKALIEALREAGLGTPATRAATLETLIARAYLVRDGKNLTCTPQGEALVDAVHPQVKSAAMTGSWELRLRRMERGEEPFEPFMLAIEGYVREVVAAAGEMPTPAARSARRSSGRSPTTTTTSIAPTASAATPTKRSRTARAEAPRSGPLESSGADLSDLLQRRFGLRDFRPHQRSVCEAITAGQDALVVMPTGAGKSLCYQLPGLARAGTTLVVSPLIALIEDQYAKLQQLGLRAERIHSGRDRLASRDACRQYLAGQLDFLFIAPERLGVPGFPEMLAKRPPALIAIDEAHCISQWGHDFRPDYRLLRARLSLLRPAPIVALTATATPGVQRDILEQLAIPSAASFILGFRRTNLAIELLACAKPVRAESVRLLLTKPGRLPAIVYAPTRTDTEDTADLLRADLKVAAYHAGLKSEERARVQAKFLQGKLDCIVATIAFGMGIDKPDIRTVVHTALPSSLEGYYQEIGRAGRDGLESRAVLLHGATDRRTHEFFIERDYPARRGAGQLQSDAAQRAHRLAQLDGVARYVASDRCRMAALVEHFGDLEDAGTRCGLCDVCAPNQTQATRAADSGRATTAASSGRRRKRGTRVGSGKPTKTKRQRKPRRARTVRRRT